MSQAMNGNISIKLLYLAIVPILIISTVLGAYFISTRMQDVNTSLTDKGKLIARSLSPAVEFGLFSNNVELLKSLTAPLLSDSDVISIRILDKNRVQIVESISSKYPSDLLSSSNIGMSTFESTVFSAHIEANKSVTNKLSPDKPLDDNPELVGWVVVKLSHYSVDSRQNEILLNAIVLIILGVIGSAVVAYTMAKKIALPLLKLTDVVHEISGGNFNARADIDGVSEIYRLQLGVNVMADIIGQTQQELKKDVIKATHKLTETIGALEEKNSRLNVTQHQLVQANAAKSEFLAKMSHEIRTPLTAVMGFSRLIEKAKNKHDIRAHTRIINQSGTQLLNIIDDILNFSKLENDKQALVADDINIRDMVEDVLNMLSSSAKEKKITLVANVSNEIPVYLRGDTVKISQILINLVSNAIKFTEVGFINVNVSLEETHNEQTQVIFEVCDTGIGVDSNLREVIFDSFSQVESDKSRSFEGTGLGLAICKKLIQLMSGEIGVTKNGDKGSRFWFCIPLYLSEKKTKTQLKVVGSQHVVFYDNLPISNQALSKNFMSWHMELYVFSEIQDLLNLLAKKEVPIDYLVLSLDYVESIPVRVGRLVKKIRSLYDGNVTILTSCAIEDSRVLFEDYRHVKILEKPISRSRLRSSFEKFTGKDKTIELKSVENTSIANVVENSLIKKRRILLAEDNKFNSMLIQALLSDRSIDCDAVKDAKGVLTLLKRTQYDLLLIDVHMPEMDGITLSQDIRSHRRIDAVIPIIAFTADVYVRNDEDLHEKGINDVLYKPLTDDSLDKMLSQWLPPYYVDTKVVADNKLSIIMSERLVDDVILHLEDIERSFRFNHAAAMNLHIHQLEGLLGHFQQQNMLIELKLLKVLANTDQDDKFYAAVSQLMANVQIKVTGTT